jgi:hypothetical protein
MRAMVISSPRALSRQAPEVEILVAFVSIGRMITLGLIGCLVAVGLVLTRLAFPRRFTFAARYRRVAWLPVTALLIEGVLWQPVLTKLSYFAVIPLLLTSVASLVLAAVGATLVVKARERDDDATALLGATAIAAIPGLLLLALMVYGFINAVI